MTLSKQTSWLTNHYQTIEELLNKWSGKCRSENIDFNDYKQEVYLRLLTYPFDAQKGKLDVYVNIIASQTFCKLISKKIAEKTTLQLDNNTVYEDNDIDEGTKNLLSPIPEQYQWLCYLLLAGFSSAEIQRHKWATRRDCEIAKFWLDKQREDNG